MTEYTQLADYLLYLAYLTKKLEGFFERQSPYIFCKRGCSKCCENGEYPFSRLEFDFIMIGLMKLPPEVRAEILDKVKRIKAEKEKFLNQASVGAARKINAAKQLNAARQLGSEAAKEEQRAGGQEVKPVNEISLSEISHEQQTDKNLSTLQPFNLSTNNSAIPHEQQTDKNPSTLQPFNLSTKNSEPPQPPPSASFIYECPFLINNECSVYDFRGIICRSFGLISINPQGNSKIPFCAFEGLNYSNVLDTDTKIISMEKYKKLGENVKKPFAFNVSYKFLTSTDIEKNFKIHFGEKKALIDWF